MIDADKRKTVFVLHEEGMGEREISRRLELGRNTVGRVIARSAEAGENGCMRSCARKRAWRSRIRR